MDTQGYGYKDIDISKATNDIPTLHRALAAAYEAMNYMGDQLNAMAACEPEDEEFAAPRFRIVREALGIGDHSVQPK